MTKRDVTPTITAANTLEALRTSYLRGIDQALDDLHKALRTAKADYQAAIIMSEKDNLAIRTVGNLDIEALNASWAAFNEDMRVAERVFDAAEAAAWHAYGRVRQVITKWYEKNALKAAKEVAGNESAVPGEGSPT